MPVAGYWFSLGKKPIQNISVFLIYSLLRWVVICFVLMCANMLQFEELFLFLIYALVVIIITLQWVVHDGITDYHIPMYQIHLFILLVVLAGRLWNGTYIYIYTGVWVCWSSSTMQVPFSGVKHTVVEYLMRCQYWAVCCIEYCINWSILVVAQSYSGNKSCDACMCLRADVHHLVGSHILLSDMYLLDVILV